MMSDEQIYKIAGKRVTRAEFEAYQSYSPQRQTPGEWPEGAQGEGRTPAARVEAAEAEHAERWAGRPDLDEMAEHQDGHLADMKAVHDRHAVPYREGVFVGEDVPLDVAEEETMPPDDGFGPGDEEGTEDGDADSDDDISFADLFGHLTPDRFDADLAFEQRKEAAVLAGKILTDTVYKAGSGPFSGTKVDFIGANEVVWLASWIATGETPYEAELGDASA